MADQFDPKDIVVPRTDAETDSSIDGTLRRFRNSLVVGFTILTLGFAVAVKANSYENCQDRGGAVTEISETIGGILHRLDNANSAQYSKGAITTEEREMARAFYQGELANLPVATTCEIL